MECDVVVRTITVYVSLDNSCYNTCDVLDFIADILS